MVTDNKVASPAITLKVDEPVASVAAQWNDRCESVAPAGISQVCRYAADAGLLAREIVPDRVPVVKYSELEPKEPAAPDMDQQLIEEGRSKPGSAIVCRPGGAQLIVEGNDSQVEDALSRTLRL